MSQHLPDGTWIQVGRAELQALQGAKFSGAERQVIDAIWCHQTGIAWSRAMLMEAAGVSEPTVKRALKRAKDHGLLEQYRQPGDRAHRYRRPLLGAAPVEGSALGLQGLRYVSGYVNGSATVTAPACSEPVKGVGLDPLNGSDQTPSNGSDQTPIREDSLEEKEKTTTTTTHEHPTPSSDTGSRTEQHGGDGFFSPRRRAAISQEVREILQPIQGVSAYPTTLRIAAALLKAEGADRLQELVEDVSEVGDNPGALLTARLRMWEETGELVIDPDSDEIGRIYEAGQERSETADEHEPKQFSGRRPVMERDEGGYLVSVCYLCFVLQDGAETDCSCTSRADRFSLRTAPEELIRAHEEWQRRSGCTGQHPGLRLGELETADCLAEQWRAEAEADDEQGERGGLN